MAGARTRSVPKGRNLELDVRQMAVEIIQAAQGQKMSQDVVAQDPRNGQFSVGACPSSGVMGKVRLRRRPGDAPTQLGVSEQDVVSTRTAIRAQLPPGSGEAAPLQRANGSDKQVNIYLPYRERDAHKTI